MTQELPLLKAAPTLALRKERVDVPEWGGAVIVRGLTGSEAFAVIAMREQSLRRVREEARERRAARAAQPGRDDGEPGADDSSDEPIEMEFDEYEGYGRHVAQLLARAVVDANGLSLCTFEDWQVTSQHHPDLVRRLHRVAERLSGLDAGAVEKNS